MYIYIYMYINISTLYVHIIPSKPLVTNYVRIIPGSGTVSYQMWVPKDVKRSTPTQQPTIPWSSLLQQSPWQCRTLQLSNRVGETTRNYHVVYRSVSYQTYDPVWSCMMMVYHLLSCITRIHEFICNYI